MLTRISGLLKKYANGWIVLVFFAGEMLFNAVILPNQQAKIEAASGGAGPIDLQLFYTPEKVYSMIEAYGDTGRSLYRTVELTVDIIYPIVYTLFFALFVTWLFQRGFAADSKMQKWNVIPLGAWLFDLLENIGIVTMLSIYPSTPAALAWLTALFTLVKWLFAGATVLLMLTGLVMALKNRFKKQDALSPVKA
ncbi:MAG: hypothetical protein ACM33V_03670 [Chloroflexota bacterium]|nr:hypothetical protein [Anaerolineales bacterium]